MTKEKAILANLGPAVEVFDPTSRWPSGEITYAKLPLKYRRQVWPVLRHSDALWAMSQRKRKLSPEQGHIVADAHYAVSAAAVRLLGLSPNRYNFGPGSVPTKSPKK